MQSEINLKMSNNSKVGVLLVNLGTPDSPSVADVRKYLREFLMDRRVIDMPYLQRFLLINLIIAPIRGPKSAKVYKELWTEKGSPLKFYGEELTVLLQNAMGNDYQVELAMRYQNPSIKVGLDKLKDKGLSKIVVIPLYPQYASSSTGSTMEKVMEEVGKWEYIPELSIIDSFPTHPTFIKAFTEIGLLLAIPFCFKSSSVKELNKKLVDCLTIFHSVIISFQFRCAAVAFLAYSFSSKPGREIVSFLAKAKAL